jgi:hypothetical protein
MYKRLLFIGCLILCGCASSPTKNFETLSNREPKDIFSSPSVAIASVKATPLILEKETASELSNEDKLIFLNKAKGIRAPFKVFSFTPTHVGSLKLHYKSAAQIVGFGNGSIISPVVYVFDQKGKAINLKRGKASYQPLGGVGRYHLFVDFEMPVNEKTPYTVLIASDTQLNGQSLGSANSADYPVGLLPALAQELHSQEIIPNVYGNFDLLVTEKEK